MKFAIVNGIRVEAMPNGKGICPCCDSETIARCGEYKMWHWAHKSNSNCDSWSKRETPWHRQCKNYFPKDWQEVVHFDELTGERHIADVKTNQGMVLEFQNSPFSEEELKSREKFYKQMLWIVHATKFRKEIQIKELLCNEPKSGRYDFTWNKSKSRDLWLSADMTVYLDWEELGLWKIEDYDCRINKGFITRVSKRIFVENNGGIFTETTVNYPYKMGIY